MAKNNLIKSNSNELLDIFVTEEDKTGTDLLSMSNFLDRFMNKTYEELATNTTWETYNETNGLLGEIESAIKLGVDISKTGTLIADTSHFSKEIVDGLKEGIYHWGESKEVSGHFRPAILDENEKLVKFVTLKKAINPSEILADVSTFTMQATLQHISTQIEKISSDIEYISEITRREQLCVNFINAREKIKLSTTSKESKREKYLDEADTFLMKGLNSLYTDIDGEINRLASLRGPRTNLTTVDTILTHINEDILMILRYVGLRIYLFNFLENKDAANDVLSTYYHNLKNWSEEKIWKEKYTAMEMIHEYYPYNDNVDFWLEQPKQMLERLDLYKRMLEQKGKDVLYIELEDGENE